MIQYCTAARQQRRRKLALVTVLKVETARAIARDALEAVRRDRDPAAERDAVIKGRTVNDLAERYIREYAKRHKRPSSIAEDERLIASRIKPRLGPKKVAAVTEADVEGLHGAMETTPYEANRSLALLSKMFRVAESWKMRPVNSNPCSSIKRYAEKKRERFLSLEEFGRLGKSLGEATRGKTEHAGVIAAIRLLIFTGMRLGEVRRLQWRNVQTDRAALWLEESKTGAKTVHLNAPALELLTRIKQTPDSEWVFPGERSDGPIIVPPCLTAPETGSDYSIEKKCVNEALMAASSC